MKAHPSDPVLLPPRELTEALGDPLPDAEQQLWAALTPSQRELAVKRLDALKRWHGERADWTASDAARAAKLSLSRFYRVARDWEDIEQRSLRLLGVQASAPRKRRSRYGGELLAAAMEDAASLVSRPDGSTASVSSLAARLHDGLQSRFEDVPSIAKLRGLILEARREASLARHVGSDLAFDLCACSIAATDEQPHRIFVCMDRGTGLILGTAVGDPADSLSGHRGAAQDALARLPDLQGKLPWAEKLLRIELVIGSDLSESRQWERDMRLDISGVNINCSNRPRRFGRYLKEHLGVSIGRIRLLPSLTLGGTAAPTSLTRETFTGAEAKIRLDLEVEDHNRSTIARLNGAAQNPPENLLTALRGIAGQTEA